MWKILLFFKIKREIFTVSKLLKKAIISLRKFKITKVTQIGTMYIFIVDLACALIE